MKGAVPVTTGRALTCTAVLLALVMSAGVSQADKGGDWGAIELANVGDEPGAFGEAMLTDVRELGWYSGGYGMMWFACSGFLSVTCYCSVSL